MKTAFVVRWKIGSRPLPMSAPTKLLAWRSPWLDWAKARVWRTRPTARCPHLVLAKARWASWLVVTPVHGEIRAFCQREMLRTAAGRSRLITRVHPQKVAVKQIVVGAKSRQRSARGGEGGWQAPVMRWHRVLTHPACQVNRASSSGHGQPARAQPCPCRRRCAWSSVPCCRRRCNERRHGWDGCLVGR